MNLHLWYVTEAEFHFHIRLDEDLEICIWLSSCVQLDWGKQEIFFTEFSGSWEPNLCKDWKTKLRRVYILVHFQATKEETE